MADSFNDQFDQHGAWRREFALRLKLLGEWMKANDLLDPAVEERLHRLEARVRSEKVMVAFVAEFSRGKSELINAIFFAGYGRRIMPASAGRTTMCPTELGYDPDVPPCLRLLPIETRLEPQSLMEWRKVPDKWIRVDLDVNDPARLAQAMEKVAEVRKVTREEARALGFWHEDTPNDNPVPDASGMVEVPRWRHALINIAHPLLRQGLVILDTPGLNAIGAEPELTVNLIPQAHAVVFILGADTGVTRSDLAIWREHLGTDEQGFEARLVVLNKIDTLWDALSTPEQVNAQIARQCASSASLLGLPESRVLPVSAQKGLVAKVTSDDKLLRASRLTELEQALGRGVMGQRQSILRAAVSGGIGDLRTEAGRVIQIRRRDIAEQMMELRGLRGKNTAVIRHMRARIDGERREFEESGSRIHAVRSVHLKLLRDLFQALSTRQLKNEVAQLNEAMQTKGLKLGVRAVYDDTFERLATSLRQGQTTVSEIEAMLAATFRQLNTDFGFSLQAPPSPDLTRYEAELRQVQRSHHRYVGVTHAFKLAQPEFSDRLVRALVTRLRAVFEAASGEIELWAKAGTAQLDAQLRERRKTFARRLEAIDRIQDAAGGLDERIAEIERSEHVLDELDGRLHELTSHLVSLPEEGSEGAADTVDLKPVPPPRQSRRSRTPAAAPVADPGARPAAAEASAPAAGSRPSSTVALDLDLSEA